MAMRTKLVIKEEDSPLVGEHYLDELVKEVHFITSARVPNRIAKTMDFLQEWFGLENVQITYCRNTSDLINSHENSNKIIVLFNVSEINKDDKVYLNIFLNKNQIALKVIGTSNYYDLEEIGYFTREIR